MRFRKNKNGSYWLTLFGLEFSGQLCRHRAFFARLSWGDGYVEGIGVSFAILGIGFWLTWKIPWKVAHRLPLWPKSEREIGFSWIGDFLTFRFAADPMGTHYGHLKGHFASLRRAWMNKEIILWRNEWVIGRDKFTKVILDERPVTIDIGRWLSDTYQAKQTIDHCTWKNRFRTTHLMRVLYASEPVEESKP